MEVTSPLLEQTPEAFATTLLRSGRRRAWVARRLEGAGWRASRPELVELARFVGRAPDARGQEAIFLEVGRRSRALLGAFLHDTSRGQAQGGLRHQPYPHLASFLSDGLRLARAMGRKNALAGLWWSGGKGLMAQPPGLPEGACPERRALALDFGDFVTGLDGCYVTAEDAGTTPQDLATVFQRTRFVTCIPEAFGGSGNPSTATALGVVIGMEAALACEARGGLAGKRVVVQGAGQVGAALVDRLLERGVAEVVVGEVSPARRRELADRWDGSRVELRALAPGEVSLLGEPCDVLAPCALGGILGPKTIPELDTGLVCGAANNPLEDEGRDGAALFQRGIPYVLDFVVNRMGIVHCANEQYGRLHPDPAVERHLDPAWEHSIPNVVQRVLESARREGIPTTQAADRLAEPLWEQVHPLWGRRTRAIIQGLIRGPWQRG